MGSTFPILHSQRQILDRELNKLEYIRANEGAGESEKTQRMVCLELFKKQYKNEIEAYSKTDGDKSLQLTTQQLVNYKDYLINLFNKWIAKLYGVEVNKMSIPNYPYKTFDEVNNWITSQDD